jgi:hypothetical protein
MIPQHNGYVCSRRNGRVKGRSLKGSRDEHYTTRLDTSKKKTGAFFSHTHTLSLSLLGNVILETGGGPLTRSKKGRLKLSHALVEPN